MQSEMQLPWLSRRLDDRSRWLLLLLITPLLLALMAPLWQMRFAAPQYPDGLRLDIFTYTVTGDVQEVNTLNHYIGMARIDRAALSDLAFLPFAIGVFALLVLRAAALGDLRSLVDLVALYTYFGIFSFARLLRLRFCRRTFSIRCCSALAAPSIIRSSLSASVFRA